MSFFLFWKTIVFKDMNAIRCPLISEYQLIYYSIEKPVKPFVIQEISYD